MNETFTKMVHDAKVKFEDHEGHYKPVCIGSRKVSLNAKVTGFAKVGSATIKIN